MPFMFLAHQNWCNTGQKKLLCPQYTETAKVLQFPFTAMWLSQVTYFCHQNRCSIDQKNLLCPLCTETANVFMVSLLQQCVAHKWLIFVKFTLNNLCILTLNVPVPYKYGTHRCVESRFHSLEPHFPRASHSRPAHSSRGSRHPRNSHSHASRGSAHFHAFAGRSSTHFHAIGSRSSAHLEAVVRRITMAL